MLEGIWTDGLDKSDLVTHLVQLSQSLAFVQQDKTRRGECRIGEGIFHLFAQQSASTCNRDFVHRHPFVMGEEFNRSAHAAHRLVIRQSAAADAFLLWGGG